MNEIYDDTRCLGKFRFYNKFSAGWPQWFNVIASRVFQGHNFSVELVERGAAWQKIYSRMKNDPSRVCINFKIILELESSITLTQ